MLQNATLLRKSAPWPRNSSDEHVSCTAPATRKTSLQILQRLPSFLKLLQNPHALLTFDQVQKSLATHLTALRSWGRPLAAHGTPGPVLQTQRYCAPNQNPGHQLPGKLDEILIPDVKRARRSKNASNIWADFGPTGWSQRITPHPRYPWHRGFPRQYNWWPATALAGWRLVAKSRWQYW